MKKLFLSILALGTVSMVAQDLPQPSPSSTLEQRVGLTDIKIEYSRPGVKDREVFGELVPYEEMWRTGANKVPNIHFSTNVTFNGEEVEAGSYALLTIPTPDSWTVILNSNTEMWGTGGYSPDKDVVRTEVESQEACFTESFTIDVNDLRNESANLVLRWAETEVTVPIEVEVQEQALANIEKAIEEASDEDISGVYRNAANYYYNNKLDMDKALKYVDKSIAGNESSWYGHWLKAEILAEKELYKQAVKSAENAIEAGKEDAKTRGNEFGYEEMIETSIETWEKMKKES